MQIYKVYSFLETINTATWWLAVSFAIALIGILDFLTGWEIRLTAFYLLPVATAAWFLGQRTGFLFAVAAAAAIIYAHTASGLAYSSPVIGAWNYLVTALSYSLVVGIVWQLRKAYIREHSLARHDPLTSLGNTRRFHEDAYLEIERARRYHQILSVAYLDVDNFKQINDKFGHEHGDRVLKVIGAALHEAVRAIDTAVRMGGDEFAILLPATDSAGADAAMDNVHNVVQRRLRLQSLEAHFSIGVITFLTPPVSVDSMLREADLLMYKVKAKGKDGLLHKTIDGDG